MVRKCHPESHNITKSCPPDFKQQPQPAVVPTAGGVVDLELVVDIEEVDDLNEAVADEQLLLVDEEIQGMFIKYDIHCCFVRCMTLIDRVGKMPWSK